MSAVSLLFYFNGKILPLIKLQLRRVSNFLSYFLQGAGGFPGSPGQNGLDGLPGMKGKGGNARNVGKIG